MLDALKKDLEGRGYRVIPATQYGFDLAIYGKDNNNHSLFLVHLIKEGERVDTLELVRSSRVAHTVNKDILLAIPTSTGFKYIHISGWN